MSNENMTTIPTAEGMRVYTDMGTLLELAWDILMVPAPDVWAAREKRPTPLPPWGGDLGQNLAEAVKQLVAEPVFIDDKSGCPDRPSPVGLLAHEYLTPDSLQCVHCLGMRREPAPRVEAPSEKPIYDGYWIVEWDDRGKVYRGVVRVETNWAKQRMVYMPNIWHANEAPFEQFAKDFRFINHVTLWSKAEKWAGRNLTPPPAPSLRNALGISCPVCHAPVDVECVRTAWEAKDGQYVPKLIERDPHSKREMAFKKYRMGSSDGKE